MIVGKLLRGTEDCNKVVDLLGQVGIPAYALIVFRLGRWRPDPERAQDCTRTVLVEFENPRYRDIFLVAAKTIIRSLTKGFGSCLTTDFNQSPARS